MVGARVLVLGTFLIGANVVSICQMPNKIQIFNHLFIFLAMATPLPFWW
jgi:hypothetical protein